MAAASGITVHEAARDSFFRAKEDGVRLIKLQIVNEEIVETARIVAAGTEESDFSLVHDNLDDTPCYLCYCLDHRTPPAEWLFVLYVPGTAKVRDRTIYASSREACKQALGFSSFAEEMYANLKEELTHDELLAKIAHDKAEAPITADERAKEEARSAEKDMTKQSTASVAFPMSDESHAAIDQLASGEISCLQLRLDVDRERLELVEASNTSTIEEAVSKLATSEPRFLFFRYVHSFGDEDQSPMVFVYACPETSPIRQKMLYSTCKMPLLAASNALGVKVDKTLEVRDLVDLDSKFLLSELHPQDTSRPLAAAGGGGGVGIAAKPSRPGKGARRLI